MVAAIALPVLVAGLFILASAVPRWTVPPPSYDLLLKTTRPYNQPPATVLVDFNVRDGRVEATLSPPVPNGYAQQWALLLYDHETGNVEEIAIDCLRRWPRVSRREQLWSIRWRRGGYQPRRWRLTDTSCGRDPAGVPGSWEISSGWDVTDKPQRW